MTSPSISLRSDKVSSLDDSSSGRFCVSGSLELISRDGVKTTMDIVDSVPFVRGGRRLMTVPEQVNGQSLEQEMHCCKCDGLAFQTV